MASSAGGGVRNIRAMFEAKQEQSSSPPSRGRSPSAHSDINSIRSTSSRPVSKIRTSFVAVEKSGQMGGPILGLRRVSDVQDKLDGEGDSRPLVTRSTSNAGESIAEEKEPEKEDVENEDTIREENAKEEKDSNQLQVNGSAKPQGPSSSAKQKSKEVTPVGNSLSVKTDISKSEQSKSAITGAVKKQPATPKNVSDKEKGKAEVKKPSTLNTKASGKVKPPTTASKTPTSATRPPIKRESAPKAQSRISTPRTSLAPNDTKDSKFVKPRPKSPTRPTRLPAAAMAATASSAAKTTSDRPSSRGSTKTRTSTDGDFLARMMRPTAASASKTHDRVTPKTTPQKTIATRPKRPSEGIERNSATKTDSSTSTKTESKPAVSARDSTIPSQATKKQPALPENRVLPEIVEAPKVAQNDKKDKTEGENVESLSANTAKIDDQDKTDVHDTGKLTENGKLAADNISQNKQTAHNVDHGKEDEVPEALAEPSIPAISKPSTQTETLVTGPSPTESKVTEPTEPEVTAPDQDTTTQESEQELEPLKLTADTNGKDTTPQVEVTEPAVKDNLMVTEVQPLKQMSQEQTIQSTSTTAEIDDLMETTKETESKPSTDDFLPLAAEDTEQNGKPTTSMTNTTPERTAESETKPSAAEIDAKVKEEEEETY